MKRGVHTRARAVVPALLAMLVVAVAPMAAAESVMRGVREPAGVAERRIALVIGNGKYRVDPLRNAPNDAADMAEVLREMRFEVDLLVDAPKRKMDEALNRLAATLRDTDVGLFYFAGHGMQDGEEQNFLVPVDAVLDLPSDVQDRAVSVRRVLSAMETAGNATNIIILDACRDNAFPKFQRSGSRGLAPVDAINGSLIAYATGPGSTAADGSRRNGLYTEHLLRAMRTPGLSLEQVFKRVRLGVRDESGRKQIPWETSSLTEDFFFLSPDGAALPRAAAGPAPAPRPAPANDTQIVSIPAEPAPVHRRASRVHIDADAASRWVAEGLRAQLAELRATLVGAGEAKTALTVVLRSTVANDAAYETKLTQLRVTVGVRTGTGRDLFGKTYDVSGSSTVDYESALKDASQIWSAVARRETLAETILSAENQP